MGIEEFDKFILENFGGIVKDNPWEKEPNFTVFRHADNQKWIALRFCATKEQLSKLGDDEILRGYADGEQIDIVNVKVEPEMIGDIVKLPGFLPAFHMNRQHWVTILLDAEVDAEKTKALVDISYNLTAKKIHKQNEIES